MGQREKWPETERTRKIVRGSIVTVILAAGALLVAHDRELGVLETQVEKLAERIGKVDGGDILDAIDRLDNRLDQIDARIHELARGNGPVR